LLGRVKVRLKNLSADQGLDQWSAWLGTGMGKTELQTDPPTMQSGTWEGPGSELEGVSRAHGRASCVCGWSPPRRLGRAIRTAGGLRTLAGTVTAYH